MPKGGAWFFLQESQRSQDKVSPVEPFLMNRPIIVRMKDAQLALAITSTVKMQYGDIRTNLIR